MVRFKVGVGVSVRLGVRVSVRERDISERTVTSANPGFMRSDPQPRAIFKVSYLLNRGSRIFL